MVYKVSFFDYLHSIFEAENGEDFLIRNWIKAVDMRAPSIFLLRESLAGSFIFYREKNVFFISPFKNVRIQRGELFYEATIGFGDVEIPLTSLFDETLYFKEEPQKLLNKFISSP